MEPRKEPAKSKRWDTSIYTTGKDLWSPSLIRAKKSKVYPVPDKQVYHGYTVCVVASGELDSLFADVNPSLQDEIYKEDMFAPVVDLSRLGSFHPSHEYTLSMQEAPEDPYMCQIN